MRFHPERKLTQETVELFPPSAEPEIIMLTACVTQAISDLKSNESNGLVAQDAWSFLTDASGNWARSRADICDMVGYNPDLLREQILQTREDPKVRRARELEETAAKAKAASLKSTYQ